MRPIRHIRQREVVRDTYSNSDHAIGDKSTAHALSDQGAIESTETSQRTSCVCGCLKQPGGFCAQCSGPPVCVDCLGFCLRCHRPLCPRHSVFSIDSAGNTVRLCRRCADDHRRKRIARAFVRTLLSPFVDFGGGDEQA